MGINSTYLPMLQEVTEALLPGGSINPPSKAINPILTAFGASLGSIGMYFLLLRCSLQMGMFESLEAQGTHTCANAHVLWLHHAPTRHQHRSRCWLG